MKKSFIILFLSILSIMSFGQEFKTKKKKTNEQEGKASFYVLANNDTIKHGAYQIKAYTGSRILLKGHYKMNKKDGLWEEQYYGKRCKGPKATGHYNNDIKVGDWTYFNFKGDTTLVYNWTENRIVSSKLCGTDNKEYRVIENGEEKKIKLDCPPTCMTGYDYFLYEFSRDIGNHSKLFKEVGNKLFQLKTKISITIDKNCSVTDISYSSTENSELTTFIESFIKSYRWIPGMKDEKYLTTKFEFSVNMSSQY